MKIYVGNLAYDVTESELSAEFGTFGNVVSIVIPSDKISGRPKGFAFVEMENKTEADAAIAGLNGRVIKERTIVVNESRPREENRGRSGSYGNRSFGGGGGGYGGRKGGHSSGGRQRRF